MELKPASQESIRNLIGVLKENINLFSTNTDEFITFLKGLKIYLECETLLSFKELLNFEIRLIEYNILVNLSILDFSTLLKLYLNPETRYDQIYACKQFYIIINESYKKIYGFSSDINKSFWNKDISSIISLYCPHLKNDHGVLKREIQHFIEDNFEDNELLDKRNLAVHYDLEPSKVYSMSVNIDEDSILKKSSTYSFLLHKTIMFSLSIFMELDKILSSKIDETLNKHTKIFEDWINEYRENEEAMRVILEGKRRLINLKEEYELNIKTPNPK
ncbi:MAG: hypothetical protein ABS67_01435 [Niabella sp. SCN 42-15]|nr:MAG: hypothetical protein ABS67_01435 [Niabella sp. SCN 42-15]